MIIPYHLKANFLSHTTFFSPDSVQSTPSSYQISFICLSFEFELERDTIVLSWFGKARSRKKQLSYNPNVYHLVMLYSESNKA